MVEGASLLHSDCDYDWLGPGAYFWEADPQRAWEWARDRAARGEIGEPAVVGAVIDLRNCLDLIARENVALLRTAYDAFVEIQKKSDLPIPKNLRPSAENEDILLLRFLDCAVLRYLHQTIKESGDPTLIPFDTVRGMFVEGEEAFPGSGIAAKSHVQVAVCNDDCIRGLFFPLQDGKRLFLERESGRRR